MSSADIARMLFQLAKESNCEYLSDLHDRGHAAQVAEAVLHIDADEFPADVWNGANHYIVGEITVFPLSTEARAFLVERLTASVNTLKLQQ